MDIAALAKQHFGFDHLRPGQLEVIQHLIAGHSAAAIFPTGGGKSLCYQLPALTFEGLTLVVSPLLALMKDQIDALRARGVLAHRLDSTLSFDDYRNVMDDVTSGRARLLYVAPERFNNERFRALLSTLPISLFAVDEAHCISEWGHNFRPDYLKLAKVAAVAGAERVLALTATATPKVAKDVARGFQIDEARVVRTPFYRSNLEVHLSPVKSEERNRVLDERLRAGPLGPSIVYVTLQKTAERVADQLKSAGHPAVAYHAGMKSEQREHIQERFMAADRGVIVATIAFGMGVDKANIRKVIHYNMPKSLENLAQEIGRAGRDGDPSVCEILVCTDDLTVLENFAYGDTPTEDAISALLHQLFDDDDELELDLYALSRKTDIRPLVLRTLLTWLELDGHLEGGTPKYAGYRFKPLKPGAEILQLVDGERREFLRAIFKLGQKKKTWVDIDVDEAARVTQSPRDRVVRALDWLAEQGHLELKPQGVRHRYKVVRAPDDGHASALAARMEEREKNEVERLAHVVRLTETDRCQVRALARYFGDPEGDPCGHCSHCHRGPVATFARQDTVVDESVIEKVRALADEHPAALGHARQRARFLAGLPSPKVSAEKLQRHPLFGRLESAPFKALMR